MLTDGRLLTNSARRHRGMSMTARCQRHVELVEDSLHIVRDCKHAREVWNSFFLMSRLKDFFSLSLKDFVLSNLRCALRREEEVVGGVT